MVTAKDMVGKMISREERRVGREVARDNGRKGERKHKLVFTNNGARLGSKRRVGLMESGNRLFAKGNLFPPPKPFAEICAIY